MPVVRSRLVPAKSLSKRRKSLPSAARSVAWCTIASGFASATARRTASRSSTSSRSGVPPRSAIVARPRSPRLVPIHVVAVAAQQRQELAADGSGSSGDEYSHDVLLCSYVTDQWTTQRAGL